MKKRLLYIAPHLSTGGLPQYLYKQIQHFKDEFEIEVVEVHNLGGTAFVVQKNKIKELVPLHTLGDDKSKILDVIKGFNPEIIHFQEIPEHDLSHDICDKIFSKERDYFIVTSTHGSLTNPNTIKYHPDRYVLVSEWSRRKFEHLGIDTKIWEYPIEDLTPNREEKKKELGMELDWKHVLMVGLFAPGKNQAEIFKVAEGLKDYKIKFHFIGNQAGNFESYWKPLMDNKPDNCIVWGERNDVEKFYEACDMFYFSSTLELNPLSVKEALSWKLPSIFRKLYTFLDTYDTNPLVHYIDDDLDKTSDLILSILGLKEEEISQNTTQPNFSKLLKYIKNGDTVVEVGSVDGDSLQLLNQTLFDGGKKVNMISVFEFSEVNNSNNSDVYYEYIDKNKHLPISVVKDSFENSLNSFGYNTIDFLLINGKNIKSFDLLDDWYVRVKRSGFLCILLHNMNYNEVVEIKKHFYDAGVIVNNMLIIKKPTVQIKHLMTRPEDLREVIATSSLKQLQQFGMVYQPIINEVYDKVPPKERCMRPQHISETNEPGPLPNQVGLGYITGRHYGCYLAHRKGLETMDGKFDYTIIFEADGYIFTGLLEFAKMVDKACLISKRDDVYLLSLANNYSGMQEKLDEYFIKTGPMQNLAHAYLIPNSKKKWWLERIEDTNWDVGDLWLNYVFMNHLDKKRYTTTKVYSKQAEGVSLLDKTNKRMSADSRMLDI